MDWQVILATVIVIASAAWLVRRVWRIVSSGSRDGEGHMTSCGTCHRNPDAAKTTPLVELEKNPKQ